MVWLVQLCDKGERVQWLKWLSNKYPRQSNNNPANHLLLSTLIPNCLCQFGVNFWNQNFLNLHWLGPTQPHPHILGTVARQSGGFLRCTAPPVSWVAQVCPGCPGSHTCGWPHDRSTWGSAFACGGTQAWWGRGERLGGWNVLSVHTQGASPPQSDCSRMKLSPSLS